ncbi:hypothetical protein [Neptuniibacter sp. 2_MG-2023]|uniref:hypothetical protein n=1 Tax=Neptuniibacter sp. 2_MG-2023 TaxID=3062671 RepID=UPI0026E130A9|nr:hypothetical protein [Neptuniibacter sp. 2_MG-2023]MDO6514397.1 hypothetical protein [Neptuniibacter sp. 2_MG-2023]
MGSVKQYYMELAEEQIEQEKEVYIRSILNDEEADESHPKWEALSNDFYEDHERRRAADEDFAEAQWSIKNEPLVLFNNTVNDLNESYKVLESFQASEEQPWQFKMLYSYGITILEAYLYELAVHLVRTHPTCLNNFVSDKDISKALSFEKYPLHEILKDPDFVLSTVINSLSNVLYHNIWKSVKIFEGMINQKFEIDITDIKQACSIRHDLVHRNGKTVGGEIIEVNYELVSNAYVAIYNFIRQIDKKITSSIPSCKQ